MAPIRTRSQAQAAGGITKKVHRKPRTAKEPTDSWELLDREGLDPNADDDDMFEDNEDHSLAGESPVDVAEVVNPLREVADKVGREVEIFAETLDRFLEELPMVQNRYDWAHDLVLQFKDIADQRVEELKKSHQREMREQLKKEWSEQTRIPAASTGLKLFTSSGSTSLTNKKGQQIKELRQWQQEADIWELFRIMLELHPFETDTRARQKEKEEQLAKLGPPHRYTSEGDLWERFLVEDDLARERFMIKTWLEQTADHQASDLQGIVEELEAKAGRGKGLWSSGWMHTREKIKNEKRLRSWPNAANSPLPQIRRSDNNELLVTTLDPDAPHRQQRTLEKPDSYFERAIWIACWEMLRRGTSFRDVCDWCEERKEGWRALCMGRALDVMEPETSSASWRHTCEVVSQSGCSTEYEAAVFGLLGGNVKAVEKVCHTIDDHLFAYYSATLLHQFDSYLTKVCPSRATPSAWRRTLGNSLSSDPTRAQQAITDLVVRLRRGESTSSEAVQPMKMIQSFLLADQVGSLIHAVGAAIGESDVVQGSEESIFFRYPQVEVSSNARDETEVAINPQTLRIAAHMYVIHRELSQDPLEGEELREDENVLVAYIQALRTAVKRSLLPTYASKLSRERYIVMLARVLQDISDGQEQRHFIRLMQEVDLDVVAVLEEQLAWAMNSLLGDEGLEQPIRMLEPAAKADELHPGLKINPDLLPSEITMSDEAITRSLYWFTIGPAGWDVTFKALTWALRKCLVTGRFATARMIISNFPFERVSLDKSYETLKRAVNIMDDSAFSPRDEEESMRLELMKKQSRTYYELELLVKSIEMLCIWRTEEEKCETPHLTHDLKATMKEVKGRVDSAMEPLLQGILLHPIDEDEAQDLAQIRLAYLPEILIAYLTVLHSAGCLVSREALLDSMDLASVIANGNMDNDGEESNGLADCFVKAGRMRQLMEVFAETSKTMLVLKASGRPWKQNRKDRIGRNLGMWELQSALANE